jgi:hypothetical protein
MYFNTQNARASGLRGVASPPDFGRKPAAFCRAFARENGHFAENVKFFTNFSCTRDGQRFNISLHVGHD